MPLDLTKPVLYKHQPWEGLVRKQFEGAEVFSVDYILRMIMSVTELDDLDAAAELMQSVFDDDKDLFDEVVGTVAQYVKDVLEGQRELHETDFSWTRYGQMDDANVIGLQKRHDWLDSMSQEEYEVWQESPAQSVEIELEFETDADGEAVIRRLVQVVDAHPDALFVDEDYELNPSYTDGEKTDGGLAVFRIEYHYEPVLEEIKAALAGTNHVMHTGTAHPGAFDQISPKIPTR